MTFNQPPDRRGEAKAVGNGRLAQSPPASLRENTYVSSFVQAKFLPIPSPSPAKQIQAQPSQSK